MKTSSSLVLFENLSDSAKKRAISTYIATEKILNEEKLKHIEKHIKQEVYVRSANAKKEVADYKYQKSFIEIIEKDSKYISLHIEGMGFKFHQDGSYHPDSSSETKHCERCNGKLVAQIIKEVMRE